MPMNLFMEKLQGLVKPESGKIEPDELFKKMAVHFDVPMSLTKRRILNVFSALTKAV